VKVGLRTKLETKLSAATLIFLAVSLVIILPTLIEPVIFPRFLLTLCFSLLVLHVLPWSHLYRVIRTLSPLEQFGAASPLLFIFILCINLGSSSNLGLAMFGSFGRNLGFLHYFSICIIFYLGLFLGYSNDKFLTKFARLLVFSMILITLLGILQYFGFRLYSYENPYSPVIATFGNPNYLSQFLALSLPSLFFLAMRYKKRLTSICISILVAITLMLNQSLQGPISVIILVFVVLFFRYRRLFLYGIFSMVLVLLVTGLIISRLELNSLGFILREASAGYRIQYLFGAIKALDRNLWLGGGIDNFESSYIDVRSKVMAETGVGLTDNAHSFLFQILGTQGIVLGSIMLGFFTISIYISGKIFKEAGVYQREFFVALASSIFIISSNFSIENQPISSIGWLALGLLYGSLPTKRLKRIPSIKSGDNDTSWPLRILRALPWVTSLVISALVLLASTLRLSDYLLLSNASSNKQFTPAMILSALKAKNSGPINELWLPDSRILYELSLIGANREIVAGENLNTSLAVINFTNILFPKDIRTLDLKAQILKVLGRKAEAYEVRVMIEGIDPFNPSNNVGLRELQSTLSEEKLGITYND